MFVWFIVAIACTIGIGAVFGQDEGFNPDNEAGIMIEEIRERFGDTPRPTEEIILGAVAKNFQNEYWRTLNPVMKKRRKKQTQPGSQSRSTFKLR